MLLTYLTFIQMPCCRRSLKSQDIHEVGSSIEDTGHDQETLECGPPDFSLHKSSYSSSMIHIAPNHRNRQFHRKNASNTSARKSGNIPLPTRGGVHGHNASFDPLAKQTR